MTKIIDDDIEVVELFKKGDKQAFEHLVVRHKAAVFNTIYSITGGAADADEIAQEVFLKVYFSAGTFRGKSSFSTWLYRITVNKCMDELRKHKGKFISLESEIDEEESLMIKDVLRDKNENIEEKMMGREIQGIMQKVLRSLPEKFRVILVLKELENLSYKEISEVTGTSMNGVKVNLFRARQKLKEKLKLANTDVLL